MDCTYRGEKMLPRMIYELLPFMYLSVGIGGGMAINSMIVFIASVLLMTTGILVLTMRISYRREIRRVRQTYEVRQIHASLAK